MSFPLNSQKTKEVETTPTEQPVRARLFVLLFEYMTMPRGHLRTPVLAALFPFS